MIEKPICGLGRPSNDYGQGCEWTELLEPAREWGCGENANGYANCYEIQTRDLSVLRLSADDFSVLHWLAILLLRGALRLSTPVSKRGRDCILRHFLPSCSDYDVIVGCRADDSCFAFARAFLSNQISLGQLSLVLRLGELGGKSY